ncbi:oligosaccharide flippase family protein [Spirosoma sp. RP8]|uniref:Oligosaccharide flippase family protein n=1 Tax=Spirosoma liriopis TaxID=2937440 RepID=A0ABT0HJH6_9BACT|nr:oligosaccharide flippase family protein [Spirosoma liriopis]MCK8492297.1 oligosaccharide flippase family protein [Spirosoma liriopis]
MRVSSLHYLRGKIRNIHPRTRKIQLNTMVGLFVRGVGMLISLVLVPMTIDYLSNEVYGAWLTISSIVTMISFFDIGIGNGLRNKLSEAISKQEVELARTYISTAYFIFGMIQIGLVLLFFSVLRFLPWQTILNTNVNNEQLYSIVLIMAAAVAIKLVLDILSYVLLAIQESGQVSLINLISNVLILCGTYTLTYFTTGNLVYIALVTAFSPIVVLVAFSYVLYKSSLKIYTPAIRFINLRYAKELLSLGYKFFVIQMAVIILFYTDNIIISQLFGASEVTTYNIAFKYFNSINIIFTIIIAPYWSAFTEAFAKNDSKWMSETYRKLKIIWIGLTLVVVVMVTLSDQVYSIWIGQRVIIPQRLSIFMGIFIIISSWNSITVTVSNGLGKVRLQLLYASFSAIINIPLAILFGKTMNMGSAGVILATSVSLLIGSVLGEIQAQRLLSGNKQGIWAK